MTVMGISMTAFAADSSVTFKDGKLTVFEPGSVHTNTDLFDNFKGVMPGDTRSEDITVQNKSKDFDSIKVYLRAVLHDETGNPVSEKVLNELRNDARRGGTSEAAYMYDFLSQLSMTVKNGETEIYKASPAELDGLVENVYLGSLRNGESLKLAIELAVPLEMGNEYANRVGEVDWVFTVEGIDDHKSYDDDDDDDDWDPSPRPPKPDSPSVKVLGAVSSDDTAITPPIPEAPDKPSVADAENKKRVMVLPKTGDTTHRVLWTVLGVGSGLMLLVLLILKRRSNDGDGEKS